MLLTILSIMNIREEKYKSQSYYIFLTTCLFSSCTY